MRWIFIHPQTTLKFNTKIEGKTKIPGFYLGQRLSVAIQRGNAASLLGTLPADSVGEEFFDAV